MCTIVPRTIILHTRLSATLLIIAHLKQHDGVNNEEHGRVSILFALYLYITHSLGLANMANGSSDMDDSDAKVFMIV